MEIQDTLRQPPAAKATMKRALNLVRTTVPRHRGTAAALLLLQWLPLLVALMFQSLLLIQAQLLHLRLAVAYLCTAVLL